MNYNYSALLVGFRNYRRRAPIGKHAILLYFIIWEYANEYRLPIEGFTVTNSALQANSGLSRRDLDIARNELKLKGYLDYKKGSGSKCGTYLLVSFDTQTGTQTGTRIDTQTDTQTGTQSDTQTHHINNTKQNNTKQNKTKQNKDMSYDISLAGLRQRYTTEQLKIIDDFFNVLKHTRKSAKLADSVIMQIYQSWSTHEAAKVIYALHRYIHTPGLHDKKENYVLGIINNTTMADIEKYKKTLGGAADAKHSRGVNSFNSCGTNPASAGDAATGTLKEAMLKGNAEWEDD